MEGRARIKEWVVVRREGDEEKASGDCGRRFVKYRR